MKEIPRRKGFLDTDESKFPWQNSLACVSSSNGPTEAPETRTELEYLPFVCFKEERHFAAPLCQRSELPKRRS